VPRLRTDAGPSLSEPTLRMVAIGIGGALGTLARYGVGRALTGPALGFPWPTFVVNVTGSLVLGLVVTVLVERWPPTRFVRPFAAIGFCGGFTTFSTMAVETARLGQHGRGGLAAAYLLASLAAGLLAAAVGIGSARGRFLPLTGRRPIPDPDDLGQLAGGPPPGPAGPRGDGAAGHREADAAP
jgi:fluoride exporter